MLDPNRPYLSFRILAVLPIVLFTPTLVAFAVAEPGVIWAEYPGVFFHLSILFVIFRMRTPTWTKAAGLAWITLDVLAGITSINGVPYDITWPIRLGGHVFAGTWIATSSLFAAHRSIRVVGVLTGVWLGGYSFVANIAPVPVLYPTSLLLVVWFALLAWRYDPRKPQPKMTGLSQERCKWLYRPDGQEESR